MPEHNVVADVSGRIWKLEVAEGQQVEEGATLLIVESMKMEIPVEAPAAGTVLRILAAEGDMVTDEQVLVVLASA
ncbi:MULTISPECIES: acetyl-CoA carboxylase biotin carboxyl carrier protein subunit [Variovorax]|jgi:acetyl-CoA carboxylase biotin carboxyl carrier protein|uniref:acetyl-CoA carboxylase biotin carboxyl carrier protein subunit n=1 Tax=Variovorax TaxID=34072 RepID=UPI0018E7779F|nr:MULTISPECIES: acetyl-CoA carboxylase biotin carboxyl carrier protein subunit [Variovorax]MBJ2155052.1 biotin/lipoyl-binding protein [Variovorax sp. IB41]MDH6166355.1 acetyl-CoA carboxylase biotin carboxyl carrier protein [Variovorax boronicumulans]